MLKVTFCAYDQPYNVGGPVTWIQRLLPSLRDCGIDSRCLFLTHWGDTGPTLSALQTQGFDCPTTACHDHTKDRARWILTQMREDPPDIFVPNLVIAGYFAARWARSAGIPTVGILHSDDDFYRGLQSEFVFGRKEFQLSALVCVSRELEKQVLDKHPKNTMVRRIPYGVPVPQRKAGRKSSVLRMAYVGRLAEKQKRISEVARSFCRVVMEVPGTEAVFFGDGPDKRNLENILSTEGVGLSVRLAGRVDSDRVQEKLMTCDVIVLLSDYEGLPIAVLEAMACGCVPVCLRMRSGIPELIDNDLTGLIVNDRGDSFVNAIWRLKNESGLLERLSRSAKAKIETMYSNRSCAMQWAELLHQLHQDSGLKRPLRNPMRLQLPPVRPELATADPRPKSLPLPLRLYSRGRMFAGLVKRHLLGQPIP